ncbi:hypothetical protein LTS18_003800 [Coniosporium uncinatum]|uniref:Uncharacterized protein n=1 Tax=Coniosporium uncinatum TaxID=93489 RepID=A0ACC3DT61_9PEZI|nr:hypothetical protein LTS18_003800 [Coniosporium uncinatum]
MSEEHGKLSKQISEAYDNAKAKKLGELSSVATPLKRLDDANEALTELQSLLRDPSTDSELRALASDDLEQVAEDVREATKWLNSSLVPTHPFAHLPCLIEIRPGAGGGEAALFAADLLRMYQAYCSNRGLKTTLMKYEDAAGMSDPNGSDAPLTEAILEVETEGAYGALRSEAGVHRVQRVPATESKGRTHTSAASVLVLPSFPNNGGGGEENFDDPSSDFYIDPKEVRLDVMRASGAGGQHVNKTESAVRLTHIPTNTVVSMQETRSQVRNREKAWQILRSRIAQLRREAREEEMVKLRRSVVGVAKTGRENKIRTYNWGQQRVTDHRSGMSVHDLDDVIEGGDSLEKVMQSVRGWMVDQELEAIAAEAVLEEKK